MRKIIAILALFALVVGTGFAADVTIGGAFGTQVVVVQDYDDGDGELDNVWKVANAYLDVSFTEETYGGRLRMYTPPGSPWWNDTPFAHAWWRPVEPLWIQFGTNGDGVFGAGQITGWGFNGGAQDYVAADNDSGEPNFRGNNDPLGGLLWKKARGTGFYGGFSVTGLAMAITPVDNLAINIGLPFAGGTRANGTYDAYKTFELIHLQLTYDIPDVGKAFISYQGAGTGTGGADAMGTAYASFFVTALDPLKLDIGVGFGLPYDDGKQMDPISVGLGLSYSADAFAVKLRAAAQFGGKTNDVDNEGIIFAVGILPSYDLGFAKVYLNTALGAAVDEDGESVMDFFINPYLTKTVGGLNFYVGFKYLINNIVSISGAPDPVSAWSIPFGFHVGF